MARRLPESALTNLAALVGWAGNLLLTGQEAAQQERQKRLRLVQKLQQSLSPEQLAALGIEPDDML